MSGRAPLWLAVALLAGLAGCRSQPAAPVGPVVLIVVDTLRADHLPCYGYGRPTAPVMCGLQADGVRFARAYTPRTATTPAIASMFTGFYPYRHGLRQLYLLLPETATTIAEILKAHAWATAGFISSFVMVRDFSGFQQGFDLYDDQVRTREAFRENYERPAASTVDAMLAWLDGQADGAHVFAFLHLIEPHGPYLPPEPFRTRFALPAAGAPAPAEIPNYQRNPDLHFLDEYVGRYDGEIASADAQIGRVLDALRARGWYDSATIALVADHGESMGDGEGWFEHGKTVEDAEAHVPLIIKFARQGDSAPPAGVVVDTPVSVVDLFPTLIAAAGIAPPVNSGSDLRAVAAGAPRPDPAPITELPRFDERGIQGLVFKAHGPACVAQWNLSGPAVQVGGVIDPLPAVKDAGQASCRALLAEGVTPLLRDTIDFRLDVAVGDRRDMSIPGRRDAFVSQRGSGVPLAEHEREALRKLGYME